MQASTYNLVSSLIILGITIFLITCLFWIGYLSLIRRIKARTLWKNSLLRKCLKLPRLCLCKAGKLIDFFLQEYHQQNTYGSGTWRISIP